MLIAASVLCSGCGSNCEEACELAADLGCRTCDCEACDSAPASCEDYFDCVVDQDGCLDIAFACDATAECDDYMDAHCGP